MLFGNRFNMYQILLHKISFTPMSSSDFLRLSTNKDTYTKCLDEAFFLEFKYCVKLGDSRFWCSLGVFCNEELRSSILLMYFKSHADKMLALDTKIKVTSSKTISNIKQYVFMKNEKHMLPKHQLFKDIHGSANIHEINNEAYMKQILHSSCDNAKEPG